MSRLTKEPNRGTLKISSSLLFARSRGEEDKAPNKGAFIRRLTIKPHLGG